MYFTIIEVKDLSPETMETFRAWTQVELQEVSWEIRLVRLEGR